MELTFKKVKIINPTGWYKDLNGQEIEVYIKRGINVPPQFYGARCGKCILKSDTIETNG